MRGHLLLVIALFFCSHIGAQSLGTKIIQLYHEIKSPVDGKFYVESIVDAREFDKNIGIAHRRLDKPVVVPLILNRDFLSDFKVATDRWRPDREGSQKISIHIKEIYLWDYLSAKEEKRFAKVQLEFFNENQESMGIFNTLITEPGKYKRFSHERRLEKALWECINKFGRQLKRPKRSKDEDAIAVRKPVKTPKYGAAVNFLHLKSQNLNRIRPALVKVDDPGLFRYRPRDPRERKKSEYYAYVEDGSLYLKATAYVNSGDYFVRVLENGQYLFIIDKINTGALSKDLFDELHQKVSNTVIGVVIDTADGVPHFVTDEYLQKLMELYPDLSAKYMIVDILSNPFQLERVRRFIGDINRRVEQLNASK